MSMVNCDHCDRYIDSDFDCDCFVGDAVVCERCREKADDNYQEILTQREAVKP